MHWFDKRLRSNPNSPFFPSPLGFTSPLLYQLPSTAVTLLYSSFPRYCFSLSEHFYLLRGVVATLSGVYEGNENVLRVYPFAWYLKFKPLTVTAFFFMSAKIWFPKESIEINATLLTPSSFCRRCSCFPSWLIHCLLIVTFYFKILVRWLPNLNSFRWFSFRLMKSFLTEFWMHSFWLQVDPFLCLAACGFNGCSRLRVSLVFNHGHSSLLGSCGTKRVVLLWTASFRVFV